MIVAGVDLGVRKAAVALLDGADLLWVGAYESKAVPRSTQLAEVASWVENQIGEDVDAVYVEEPLVGRSTRISLQIAQTAGAVLSSLAHLPHSYLVSNTAWKKQIVGNGNASKEMIRMWLDEMFPGYASHCDGDQDQYDASCIALYGAQQQRLADRIRGGELVQPG